MIPYGVLGCPKKFVSLPMIILFVFAETKIIKKADSYNRCQPKFLLFKKFYRTVIIDNTECLESSTIENESSGSTNSSAVGEALIELVFQPHQVQTGGGGGDSDNRGWRDDDRNKDNNKNRTYKRRR